MLSQAKLEVDQVIEQWRGNELEAQPGRTMKETFEDKVNAVLNKARDDAGKMAQNSLTLHVSGSTVSSFIPSKRYCCLFQVTLPDYLLTSLVEQYY